MVHLDSVSSTQDEARARFVHQPVLITASRQIGGRGRTGREWVHADRAMAVSLALRPSWPVAMWPTIPLVAGLAAHGLLAVGLKWPNDLVTASGKVGGILVEADGDVVVIGCGINLYWEDPIPGAAAMFAGDPGPEVPNELAGRWATDLLQRLAAPPGSWGHAEYRKACVTIGCDVTWDPDGEGVAVDVDQRGALVVESGGERRLLTSGEVREVRPRA